ncbi:hypothetical protein KIN20_033281 [Parelaphostrongylus tenuis]|uniref:Uncharacterized protein n=1 Tax=Parelaphostrongylus tenuis TaxID=148309 RepID=A0AAD5R869_PARTN|nr:hypothetical protein KIN20_033281 [Parelaphostrongylus tenuis]
MLVHKAHTSEYRSKRRHRISSDVRMTGFRLGSGGKKEKLSPPGAKPQLSLMRCQRPAVSAFAAIYTTSTCHPPLKTWNRVEHGICSLHHQLIDVASSSVVYAQLSDEDGGYYVPQDKLREMLRDPMKLWKTAGFCVFASGALLLAVSLMIPTLAACIGSKRLSGFISEDNSPNEPPVRIYPQEKPSVSHTSGPIPVLEEITKVQPGEKVAPSGLLDSDKT